MVRDLPDGSAASSSPDDDYVTGDFNPERVLLDDAIDSSSMPVVDVGDSFETDPVGVLDYSFGTFKLLLTAAVTRVPGGIAPERTRPVHDDELSVATFNVENLDPTDPPAKFQALAHQVVDSLAAPDVLAVEEIQDDTGAECPNGPKGGCAPDGTTSAGVTLRKLADAIQAAGGPAYDWREVDPENLADGGQPTGNIRVAFLFRPDRVSFVDRGTAGPTTATEVVEGPGHRAHLTVSPGRIDPTDEAWTNSRKPLAGEFRFRGRTVIVVANHWASKGGDRPLFGRYQPPWRPSEDQRTAQARVVADWVENALAVDPRANLVVVGDLNDYEFSPAVRTLRATGLLDLPATLPLPERYTYDYEGNSEVLDHILLSPYLAQGAWDYDVVHVNAEFAEAHGSASDHDPQVVRLRLRR